MSKRKTQVAVPPEPTADYMTVTPDLALQWLDEYAIGDNRVPRDTKVATIQRDIEDGLFVVNGETIKFDLEGKLFDGQHRLQACIHAGIPIRVLVCKNLPLEAMQTVDQNTPRTMGDLLRWRGETDVNILSSIIRLAWLYDHDLLKTYRWRWVVPSVQASVKWFDERPDELREALVASRELRRKPVYLTPSVAGAFYWIAVRRYPEETVKFVRGVAEGENLPKGPILAYRDYVSSQRGMPQIDQRAKLATILTAFTWHLIGKKVNKMAAWQPRKGDDEGFPELPDPAALTEREPVAAGSTA